MRHHVTAGVVAFAVASVTASAGTPPLPVATPGSGSIHWTRDSAQDQRIRDLSNRLANAEEVIGWVHRCISGDPYQTPSGQYAVTFKPACVHEAR